MNNVCVIIKKQKQFLMTLGNFTKIIFYNSSLKVRIGYLHMVRIGSYRFVIGIPLMIIWKFLLQHVYISYHILFFHLKHEVKIIMVTKL